MPALFLASASPRRHELLRAAGFAPRFLDAQVEESSAGFLSARELVALNAHRKLRAAIARAAEQLPKEAVVVAADTLVSLGGVVLGKPRDLEEAAAMLGQLSGRTHQVLTGVAIGQAWFARRRVHFVERSDVRFRKLSQGDIAAYLARIEPLDKAGGYAAQENGRDIIAAVSGSWSNVVGLPMETLGAVLARFGIHPEAAAARG